MIKRVHQANNLTMPLGGFNRLALAWRVFGRETMAHAQERIAARLESWGYRSARTDLLIRTFMAQLLLVNRSARLEDLTDDVFRRLRDDPRLGRRRRPFHAVHRAVAEMGNLADIPTPAGPTPREIASQPSFSSCQPDST